MNKKYEKGNIKYLSYMKKYTILRTALYFGISFAILIIGFVTTKTKNNLLTIVAVLGVLPAGKSLVNTIMYVRFKPISDKLYNALNKYEADLNLLFNMLVSSSEKIYFIKCIVINEHSVYAFTDDKKIDDAAFTKYIKNYLSNNGKGNVNVKVYRDEKSFCKRLDEILKKQTVDGKNKNDAFESKLEELIKIICL